jgi:hypothetical protein
MSQEDEGFDRFRAEPLSCEDLGGPETANVPQTPLWGGLRDVRARWSLSYEAIALRRLVRNSKASGAGSSAPARPE